jgi:hypothetical protein
MNFILRVPTLGLALVSVCLITSNGQPQTQKVDPPAKEDRLIPLKFGTSIPLSIQSDGVEWKGNVYHLLGLGSIQFASEKGSDHLIANIKAGTTSFDDVDYDISGAVFDAAGRMLGVARAQCHVDRTWLGHVLMSSQTITLDFGRSLDYPNASAFMLTVSKRKVLTPDDWQKAK